jgi:hypothetical protein
LPTGGEVVLIYEPFGRVEPEARQRYRSGIFVEDESAEVRYAVIPPMDVEAMEVLVLPAHQQLDDAVQIGD